MLSRFQLNANHSPRVRSFFVLALVGLLCPPTVTPCPVKAGLTNVRGASCCATKAAPAEAVAEAAPVRSCCARRSAKPARDAVAQQAAPAAGCGMQTSCCCKARPAPSQAVLASITRTSESLAGVDLAPHVQLQVEAFGLACLSSRPVPDSPAHLNRLLCTWQI